MLRRTVYPPEPRTGSAGVGVSGTRRRPPEGTALGEAQDDVVETITVHISHTSSGSRAEEAVVSVKSFADGLRTEDGQARKDQQGKECGEAGRNPPPDCSRTHAPRTAHKRLRVPGKKGQMSGGRTRGLPGGEKLL